MDSRKGLHLSVWGVQIILGFVYFSAGVIMADRPIDELANTLPWVRDVPVGLVHFIAVIELCGALGVVLPSATRIAPRLAGLAAIGLATLMALATGFLGTRGEWAMTPLPLVLGGLALFVAWGRLVAARIPPARIPRPTRSATSS